MNRYFAAGTLLLFSLVSATAGDVDIDGAVVHPLHLNAGALRSLPSTEVTITAKQDSDVPAGTFKGVLLNTLLARALTKDKPGKHTFLQHTITVIGRDGYAAALAVGEFDPALEGKFVILAYDIDGRPFRDGFHLVVPGDKQGARQVRDVVRIEVQ